jgi:hypothetical protein
MHLILCVHMHVYECVLHMYVSVHIWFFINMFITIDAQLVITNVAQKAHSYFLCLVSSLKKANCKFKI